MKIPTIAIGLVCMLVFSACSYDSIRMHERQRCGAMPGSQSQNCYQRTAATKAEYDARRNELKHSAEKQPEKSRDPRYNEWVP